MRVVISCHTRWPSPLTEVHAALAFLGVLFNLMSCFCPRTPSKRPCVSSGSLAGSGFAFPVSDDLASLEESWAAVMQRVPPLGFVGCVSQIQLSYGSCEDDLRGQVPLAHVVFRMHTGGRVGVGVGGLKPFGGHCSCPGGKSWMLGQPHDAPRTSERRPGLTVRRYRWRLAGRVLDAESYVRTEGKGASTAKKGWVARR